MHNLCSHSCFSSSIKINFYLGYALNIKSRWQFLLHLHVSQKKSVGVGPCSREQLYCFCTPLVIKHIFLHINIKVGRNALCCSISVEMNRDVGKKSKLGYQISWKKAAKKRVMLKKYETLIIYQNIVFIWTMFIKPLWH